MYLLSYTLATCDVHDVEALAVSDKRESLQKFAQDHCAQIDNGERLTVHDWEHRDNVDWYAPIYMDGEDSQEMYYTITEIPVV